MFRLLCVVLAFLLMASFAHAKPNVIVIVADDLGWADISLHGAKDIATPNIDSLAKNGIRCTNGYVSCPYCSPTRAALLTGRYQQKFGHEFNPALLKNDGKGQGLPIDQVTIIEQFKKIGYRTGLVGKWHQGEEEQFHPLNRGFESFFGFLTGAHSYRTTDDANYGPIYRNREKIEFEGYFTDVLATEAVSFMERDREKPYLLYLAFNAVHTPMHAPPRLLEKFANEKDKQRQTYLAMLAGLDEAVGKVLAKAGDDTLIFFISDNGGPTTKFAVNGSRNTPLRGSKGDTWEGGIHVPFFVQWKKRLPAGKSFTHPVMQFDILPTAFAAASDQPLTNVDGVNLLPYLEGKKSEAPHEFLFWRFGSQMAVRSGEWKLVRPSRGKGPYEDVAKDPMLFNVVEDVAEENDVAGKYPDRVKAMQAKWDQWNATLMEPRWPATLLGKVIKP